MGRRIDLAKIEARHVVARAGRMIRTVGVVETVAFFARLVVEHLSFPLLKRRRAHARIRFAGAEIPYAYHLYSQTWRNERCLEVAIANHFLTENRPGRMLEIGNVLSHFGFVDHEIVDKYEQVPGVRNADILTLDEPGGFDTVVSISTLEHVLFDEAEKDPRGASRALESLRRTVAPGGRLLVTVPIGYNPGLDEDIRSGRFFLPEQTFYQRVSAAGDWVEVSAEQALRCSYGTPYEAANAVLVGIERAG